MCVCSKIIFWSTPERGNSTAASQILTETSPYLWAGLLSHILTWCRTLIQCPTLCQSSSQKQVMLSRGNVFPNERLAEMKQGLWVLLLAAQPQASHWTWCKSSHKTSYLPGLLRDSESPLEHEAPEWKAGIGKLGTGTAATHKFLFVWRLSVTRGICKRWGQNFLWLHSQLKGREYEKTMLVQIVHGWYLPLSLFLLHFLLM